MCANGGGAVVGLGTGAPVSEQAWVRVVARVAAVEGAFATPVMHATGICSPMHPTTQEPIEGMHMPILTPAMQARLEVVRQFWEAEGTPEPLRPLGFLRELLAGIQSRGGFATQARTVGSMQVLCCLFASNMHTTYRNHQDEYFRKLIQAVGTQTKLVLRYLIPRLAAVLPTHKGTANIGDSLRALFVLDHPDPRSREKYMFSTAKVWRAAFSCVSARYQARTCCPFLLYAMRSS